jgi:hypothetical protein
VPALSEEGGQQTLKYSRWSKMTISDVFFFTGRDIRRGCKSLAGATLAEQVGELKKTLRVVLPVDVAQGRGARIAIDQAPPIDRPYAQCFGSGCIADYEAGPELIDQLRRGTELRISAFSQAGAPLDFSFPLAGFAEAYDGPAQEPKVYEYQTSSKVYQDMLKREEEERKARCGSD